MADEVANQEQTTITQTSQVLNLDIDRFVSDFKAIENAVVDTDSIYDKTITYLKQEFDNSVLSPKEKLTLQSQLMGNITISLTAKAMDVALQMQQVAGQLSLTQAEIEFNKARTDLVKAQTDTEKEKKNAVIREIQSYDDNLREKEASHLTNAVFAYASGGVSVPSDLQSKMLTAIDKITPESL